MTEYLCELHTNPRGLLLHRSKLSWKIPFSNKQTNKQVNTLKEKAKNAIIFPIVISNVTGFAFKGEAGTVYFKAQSTSDVQKEFMSNVCESENTYPLPFN